MAKPARTTGQLTMQDLIYKICPNDMWQQAEADGVFHGAPVDTADGFIHFSTAHQLAETAAKHFAGQDDLLLITVATASLGESLKWEPSRGGALFPHLYGSLTLDHVRHVDPFPLDASSNQVASFIDRLLASRNAMGRGFRTVNEPSPADEVDQSGL